MPDEHVVAQLWASLESKKAIDAAVGATGWDALRSGDKIRKKISEQAGKLGDAHSALLAGHETKDRVAHAAGDLWYECLLLLATVDVTPAEVMAVLQRRLLELSAKSP
jgi:phosphoribosyl-ATP pyrophosphohydrolase